MPNKNLNIVYCCSDLFSEVCGVSITSLFENNKSAMSITVYIIDDGISEDNKVRLGSLAECYSRRIEFIKLPNAAIFFNDERCSIKTLGHSYGRLLLAEILPKTVNRILSLDSDTLVLDELDELWELDMGDCAIGGVDDCMGNEALVKTQHNKANSLHCNGGVFLIDLNIWRKENWTKMFYSYIKQLFDKGVALGGYEEEVINYVLNSKMYKLSPRYNLMTLEQVLTYEELIKYREPIDYYSKEEIKRAIEKPVIIHGINFFYTRVRMFYDKSDHPQRINYVKYRELSPWKNAPAMKMESSIRNILIKSVWHWMPRKISLRLAKYVRTEIRPKLKKKRDDE